ncbi:MAG TPA: O-antigen ligase family protein [Chitinophagales bacterium]|nr:O-antigen ligase family protein [Chitinophagales bacterium]
MTRAIDRTELGAFAFLGIATIASVLAAFGTGMYYLALIPFGLLVAYTAVINFKLLYYFLLVSIPVSIEYYFSESLATDLPDEPLMIGLMLVTFIFIASNYKSLPTGFLGNFFIAALLLHLFWIFISALTAINFVVSIKVFTAKLWYITTFTFLTAVVIRTKDDFKKLFWCIYIPLTLLIIQVIIRHGMQNFSFEQINDPMMPFFRNHVNYAAIVSIFFPFILWARGEYTGFKRNLLSASLLLYIVAIYLSYTRTCYIALLLLYPVYLVVRYRLMKPALLSAFVVIVLVVGYLFTDKHFMKFAPDFEETIIHDRLDEHLSSTFEGKDVSSMERVYRWVAATQMFPASPYVGIGPGNFYPYYKRYTVTSFETYVSDNPERSTTHNYALFLLSEQGAIGLAVFLFLTVVIFVYGEVVYHRIQNKDDKRMVLTLLLVMAMIYVNLLLSDMLESDKVGPFFFISLALLAAADIRNRKVLLKPQG